MCSRKRLLFLPRFLNFDLFSFSLSFRNLPKGAQIFQTEGLDGEDLLLLEEGRLREFGASSTEVSLILVDILRLQRSSSTYSSNVLRSFQQAAGSPNREPTRGGHVLSFATIDKQAGLAEEKEQTDANFRGVCSIQRERGGRKMRERREELTPLWLRTFHPPISLPFSWKRNWKCCDGKYRTTRALNGPWRLCRITTWCLLNGGSGTTLGTSLHRARSWVRYWI